MPNVLEYDEVEIIKVKGSYPYPGIRCDYCLNPFSGILWIPFLNGRKIASYPLHNRSCCDTLLRGRSQRYKVKTITEYDSWNEYTGEEKTES